MYKVLVRFADKTDDDYVYEKGDVYPRDGITPSKTRVNKLSAYVVELGGAAIKEVPDPKDKDKE